jgi:predicted ester cyclase
MPPVAGAASPRIDVAATILDPGRSRYDGRMDSIRARLARSFDPLELRRIKRLWVRHSVAEDRRDIDGLIGTLSPTCRYEVVPTGQRWHGHAGARAFYTELFAAFPDNRFALSEIVVGAQGVFEVATLTGTNEGPWAGAPPSGLPVALEVLILFPWDPATERFAGERIWFDRGGLPA